MCIKDEYDDNFIFFKINKAKLWINIRKTRDMISFTNTTRILILISSIKC